jgi:hypothetical protein
MTHPLPSLKGANGRKEEYITVESSSGVDDVALKKRRIASKSSGDLIFLVIENFSLAFFRSS